MTRPFLIAQNLNASDASVAAAIAAGDAGWLRAAVRRIEAAGMDAIDLNAGTFGDAEGRLLRWMVEQVEPSTALTLSLDSADPGVLASVAAHVQRPAILNSLACDVAPAEAFLDRLAAGCQVVLSLHRADALPSSAEDRWTWAQEGISRLEARGVDPRRIWVDAIALPWGDDFVASRPMLDFVERWAVGGTGAGCLVGLGNLGHGRKDAVRINREWWGRLRRAGIAAALVDAFEPGLREEPDG